MIGFQAAGTLGRRLVDGAETVRILGDEVPVRARVATLGGFSAHADQSALLAWLGHLSKPPRRLFLVHGEEDVAAEFATRIEDTLRWKAHVPQLGETVAL
jgi:metallo-beta-lactamase family protein